MAEHFLEGRLAAFVEHTEKTLTDIPKDEDKLPLLINLAAAHYGMYIIHPLLFYFEHLLMCIFLFTFRIGLVSQKHQNM